MPIPYQWREAETVAPTAQAHTDVPDWMTVWDRWSRDVIAGWHATDELEQATKRSAA